MVALVTLTRVSLPRFQESDGEPQISKSGRDLLLFETFDVEMKSNELYGTLPGMTCRRMKLR